MTPEQIDRYKKDQFLKILESPAELRDWVLTYLDIDLTFDTIDPDSTSNPLDAMWSVYEAVKNNTGDVTPGYILLSAREAFKTLSASILEVLIFIHFQISISHMAAILKQSDKAVSYITGFFNKLKVYLEHYKWKKISDSKTKIQYLTPEGNEPYIVVVICTMAGANSEHTPLMFIDEIDVVRDPQAYEEAKLIPSMDRGRYPLTVKLSTRKFAFGMMSKELENAKTSGEEIKRWNILDITEKCPPSRSLIGQEKTEVYVAKNLPLNSVSKEAYDQMVDVEKSKFEQVMAHKGCLKCKLLPVCKTRLSDKPDSATGGLYRPIPATILSFSKVSPDMAEAQLLCLKPSSKGLIYPKFEADKNVLTHDQAMFRITGEPSTSANQETLVSLVHSLGVKIVAGVDWGFTHDSTIVVMAIFPGFSLIIDTFALSGLETHEFVEECAKFGLKYKIDSWYCDTARPDAIKTLKKKLRESGAFGQVPEFKKDIFAGIEAIRSQLVSAQGVRSLFVVNNEGNQKLISGFKVHHFKLDGAGNPTKEPDDEEFADVMDSLRYIGQNVFDSKSGKILISGHNNIPKPIEIDTKKENDQIAATVNENLMKNEISKLTGGLTSTLSPGKKKIGIGWNF